MVCKLDTGANCCVISKEDVLSLPRKTREACRATLTSFFGHKTTAQFKVKLSLSVNDKQHDETFFVIEQNVPVTLSGAAAESLGLIYRVDSVETQQLYPEAQPFTDVFTGLGQLKNFEYEMKLKPGAVGVVVPARRVPVAIEEKVKAELQRMEEHNVITKEQVRYLGHVFTTQGLSLGPDRVQAILDMPAPSNKADGSTDENTAPGSLLPPEAGTIAQQEGALPSPGDSPQAEGLLQSRCSGPARPLTGSEGLVVRHAHTDVVPGRCAGISGSSTLRTGKTEDGREMRRTREHLREVPELPCPDTTTTPSSGLPGSGPVPEPPLPRRSTRERREPRRYPMPERPILPQGRKM
ncbi:uncharacterized protein LOC119377894 isoform X1 [Rhipicephalus sanguineus]|uniref:uncharacterized protein LOC119377894 isoform X1 n=1 Tax=Rhipicephalus sanguineus TaxID=34632 RepID=UPI0020C390E3|nr:uncharacterized protein LOC119377894 isoform X1 [Rhipicephalus sanguineus]